MIFHENLTLAILGEEERKGGGGERRGGASVDKTSDLLGFPGCSGKEA